MSFRTDFTPRRALVTGGSSGIGQAVCLALGRMGCDVALTYRSNRAGAEETCRALAEMGVGAFAGQVDLTQPAAAVEGLTRLTDALGGLDACVANAGVTVRSEFLDMTFEEWRANLGPDLDGSFLTLQHAAKRMVADGVPGVLVAITSVHAHVAMPGGASYTAAKHGLRGLVKALALDLGPYGIRVNAVAPGDISTGDEGMPPRPGLPADRPGTAREVADVVAFLCSAQASYVTGTDWTVDGGFTAMTARATLPYRDE
ncbi:MAG: SDR family oxidoreductase [Rhodospirillaceae bacterium]